MESSVHTVYILLKVKWELSKINWESYRIFWVGLCCNYLCDCSIINLLNLQRKYRIQSFHSSIHQIRLLFLLGIQWQDFLLHLNNLSALSLFFAVNCSQNKLCKETLCVMILFNVLHRLNMASSFKRPYLEGCVLKVFERSSPTLSKALFSFKPLQFQKSFNTTIVKK